MREAKGRKGKTRFLQWKALAQQVGILDHILGEGGQACPVIFGI